MNERGYNFEYFRENIATTVTRDFTSRDFQRQSIWRLEDHGSHRGYRATINHDIETKIRVIKRGSEGLKRLLDLIGSLLIMVCLSPIILFIGIMVRIKIGTPVFFIQVRPGLHEKSFFLLKFRTMTNAKNLNGELLPDVERMTPFGKWLRKYSLDELPQLFNVIKGDLSLVGPRPLLMEYLPLYTEEQKKRHDVRPGITGWAQINGRNLLSWEKKFELDLWYVQNRSFLLDVKILFLTVLKVIRSEGITQPEHETAERFNGTNSKVKEGHG